MFELSDAGTTPATNLLLSVEAIVAVLYFERFRDRDLWKVRVWQVAGLCMFAANMAAAAFHGLVLSPLVHSAVWAITELSLGLMIGAFVVGTVHDLWNAEVSRRAAPVMLVVAMLYFVVTHVLNGSFLIYVLYQALCVGFAFLGYGLLALKGRLPGAALAWAGLLLILTGAVLQQTGIEITLIWSFDHNGVFHLFQLFGVALLVLGLGRSLERA